MKIKKKSHFTIGKHINCKLFFRVGFSNVFVTLTDIEGKVIVCKTAGSSILSNSKKQKKAPHTVEKIVNSMRPYFQVYRIKKAHVVLRNRRSKHVSYLFKELHLIGVTVSKMTLVNSIPHGGVRGRKLRRV